jgi:acyl carrier protein
MNTRGTIRERAHKLIANRLFVDEDRVVDNAHFQDDLGADSLDRIEVIMSIEEEFGIEILDDEVDSIATFGELINYLEKKVGQ